MVKYGEREEEVEKKLEASFGRIGRVPIGQGYPIQTDPKKKFIFPRDAVEAFLSVDSQDKNQIDWFCENYIYIPSETGEAMYEAFANDQRPFLEIKKALLKEDLTQDDLFEIAHKLSQYLKENHSVVTVANLGALKIVEGDPDIKEEDFDSTFFLRAKESKGFLALLAEQFLEHILKKQKLDECTRCGRVFWERPGKIYCSQRCQNNANVDRSRAKTRAKPM